MPHSVYLFNIYAVFQSTNSYGKPTMAPSAGIAVNTTDRLKPKALGPGALGKPRGSGWRGRWEGGSGWGTHVNPWLFQFNV